MEKWLTLWPGMEDSQSASNPHCPGPLPAVTSHPDDHLLPGVCLSSPLQGPGPCPPSSAHSGQNSLHRDRELPGELSPSRIRKAPGWFQLSALRISSASCREIRPEYHLQRGQREGRGRPPCPVPGTHHSQVLPAVLDTGGCDCTHFTDYQPKARRGRSHVPKVTDGGRQELYLVPAFCLLSTNLANTPNKHTGLPRWR